jgi:uncharacterized protein YPO0396
MDNNAIVEPCREHSFKIIKGGCPYCKISELEAEVETLRHNLDAEGRIRVKMKAEVNGVREVLMANDPHQGLGVVENVQRLVREVERLTALLASQEEARQQVEDYSAEKSREVERLKNLCTELSQDDHGKSDIERENQRLREALGEKP